MDRAWDVERELDWAARGLAGAEDLVRFSISRAKADIARRVPSAQPLGSIPEHDAAARKSSTFELCDCLRKFPKHAGFHALKLLRDWL